jgi:hypothetical protein
MAIKAYEANSCRHDLDLPTANGYKPQYSIIFILLGVGERKISELGTFTLNIFNLNVMQVEFFCACMCFSANISNH